MPDRFATAVWLNPAAMRQCRTFFAKCDTPLLLLVLEVWRGFSAISQSAYPTSWTVARQRALYLQAALPCAPATTHWRRRLAFLLGATRESVSSSRRKPPPRASR